MIIGECPYCDSTMMTSISKHAPSFTREKCGECGKYSWLFHSRIAPVRYPVKEFNKKFRIIGNKVVDRGPVHKLKIHKGEPKDFRHSYLCNWACGITKGKYTRRWPDVTCKNCLRRKKK